MISLGLSDAGGPLDQAMTHMLLAAYVEVLNDIEDGKFLSVEHALSHRIACLQNGMPPAVRIAGSAEPNAPPTRGKRRGTGRRTARAGAG